MEAIYEAEFYHTGRGPVLKRVHWAYAGERLRAIDYRNGDSADPHHVRFIRPQVVAITPEEVINYATVPSFPPNVGRGALIDRGRSEWLQSFAQTHLAKCRHYSLLFYDQMFDVICEGVVCEPGEFKDEDGATTA